MRRGATGFLLGLIIGVACVVIALLVLRQKIVHDIADDLSYRFDHYVFDTADFPQGDFAMGRLIRRALWPAHGTVTFYDAHYHPVTKANAPGRYGAVVRMDLGGKVTYRFITLYHTATPGYWRDAEWPITAQTPTGLGLDPATLSIQSAQIADLLRRDIVSDGDTTPALAVLLAGLSETPPTEPPAVRRTNAIARDETWWYGLRKQLGLEPRYRYLVDLPKSYDDDPAKRWPLILYLGTGQEFGNDLSVLRKGGPPLEIDKGRQIPAIVVSPQNTTVEPWSNEALAQFIDDMCAKYRIDPDRIYSTGGGIVWQLAQAYPERFAALVPIDGENDATDAARLKDIPTWAFQGRNEDYAPVWRTTNIVDAIARAGGHPHLTFSDGHHDVWDQAFGTDALYTWLLAQKRGQPEVIPPGVPATGSY